MPTLASFMLSRSVESPHLLPSVELEEWQVAD